MQVRTLAMELLQSCTKLSMCLDVDMFTDDHVQIPQS